MSEAKALNRCEKLYEALQKTNCVTAVIHRAENMRYLTGFTGEGCVYIHRGIATIVTDFRYIEAAQREAPGLRVERTTSERKEADVLLALTDGDAVRTLAVETDYLTYDAYEELGKKLPFVELVSLKGIPEQLRMIKDADEIASICKACELSCRARSSERTRAMISGARDKASKSIQSKEETSFSCRRCRSLFGSPTEGAPEHKPHGPFERSRSLRQDPVQPRGSFCASECIE